jgi:hypothetical protein
MSYEKWGFTEYPYGILKTRQLKPDKITWNRDDLEDKGNVENFINDILDHRSVSLKIWGPTRSGKTWLLNYIEKKLHEKFENNIMIIYTDIPSSEPTIDNFYGKFIDSLLKKIDIILPKIEGKIGKDQSDWENYFEDPELGAAIYHLRGKSVQKPVAVQWLKGEKISSSVLRSLNIISSLNKAKKIENMIDIITVLRNIFESFVLMVDEIGLIRPPSAARAIGNTLQILLDRFDSKFGLICTYTASLANVLLDLGYSEHFYKRFDYDVQITALPSEYVPEFLRLHHTVYRKPDYKVKDQLYPFALDGIKKILEIIGEDNYYPGYILHTCGSIASEALKSDVDLIHAKFIEDNKKRIPKDYIH